MDDEFKNFGNEMNKPISEFKNIEAMEYYPVKEAVAGPVEFVGVNEDSASNDAGTGESQSALDRFNETQENIDRLSQARNTADGLKSPDINMTSTGAEAEAEAAAAEASTAATVSATSTVASVAGSFSVVVAAAATMAVVAGGILEKEPVVNLVDFESGTNYLKYEIDVTELSENMDYKIRVSNPNFSIEYPILEEGLQCQIVPDLKPFRRYSLEVIGNSAELGDFVYFSKNIYTNELPKPKAVFKFTPHFDYLYGRIDLEYETFISDFYNSGSNVYLQIYSGSRLLLEDHDLPEDNFFRGTIYNLPSTSKITAVAYADYFNGVETELEETIGTYGYELELPDDFELMNLFKGTYTFGDECFSQNFDFETGINTLSIDTNFKSDDADEAYRIDVYNDDKLYKTLTTNEKVATLELEAYLRTIDVKFTPIRKNGESVTEYDSVLVKQYDVDPKIFNDISFGLSENNYYFYAELTDSIAEKVEDKPFTLKMVKTLVTGEKVTSELEVMVVDRAYLSIENSLSEDETVTVSDFESFDVELICDGKILSKFFAQAEPKITFGQADVDDDGNVVIPYEIEVDDKIKNLEIYPFIGGLEAREPLTEKKGNIVLEEISGNVISGNISVSYVVNGTRITNSVNIEEINLGVDYDVSYFISHNGSYYETLNIKFDTTINGKNANINLYPMADRGDDFVAFDDLSNEKYLGYYRISNYSDTFSYKIGAYGFDDTVYTIENINTGIGDSDSNTRVAELNSYSAGNYDNVNEIYYVNYYKDKNSDGTVNYYINSNLSATLNHYARIEGKYIDSNGNERYYFSPFTQDSNITLLNLPDEDYDFVYRVYYKYGDIFYDTEFAYNKYYYELKSSEDLLIDSRTFVGKLENNQFGTLDSVVNFELYTEGLSTDPITLTYNKKDYEIYWDISSDLLSSWAETEYNGTNDAISNEFRMDGYTYSLMFYNKVDGVYKNLAVEFYIVDDEEPLDTNPKIKYKSSGTIMSKEFSTEREENLVEYEGKYDIDSIYYTYDTSGDSNVIYVYVPGANLKNKSMLMIEAYYNGELISRDNINSSGYTYFYIGSGYTDIDFYLVEVIQQNNDSFRHNNTNDSNDLEFNRYKLESPILPAQNIVLDDINLSYDVENNEYTVSGTASDFSDYKIQVKVHYNNNGEKFTYEYTSEMGINNISFINEGNIESIDVLVLRYGNTCVQSNTINTSIDISDVDIDETVLVPYYVPIPKDATLSKLEVSVNGLVHEFSDTDGVIEIEELETNIVDFSFNVTYVDKNGATVNYVLDMTKELEVTFDYDYSISTYHDSSYGYTEDISISYDATDLNYYMYFAKIKVIPKVGSIVLSNYTDYTVTFLKGGDSYYASPAEIEEIEVSGTRFVNGYNAIMYHDIETSASGTTLLAIKGCSLEFSIAGGEKQTINFTPPSSLNSVKSYFGTQLDITNSASWISKHGGVMDVTIDTGFDVSEHPDYAYFATIRDSDFNSRETEITTSGVVTFEGLNPDEVYTLMLYICYKDGDGYVVYRHNYYEMRNINKVLDSYNAIGEYGPTDPEKYGSFNIYSYMIDTNSDITIVVDEGLATQQTKVLSASDLVDGTTIALQNGISIVIQDNTQDSNYYSIFIKAETVDTDLTTAKITLTDVFGGVKTFNI